MPAEINQTTIANRALQILGYPAITDIKANDRGARAMDRAYRPVLLSLLQENYWGFSIKRASLAEDTEVPLHGYKKRYKLPGDYLMMAPEDQFVDFPTPLNRIEEGGYILTDESAPLEIRYVSLSILESQFPPLFAEALSAALAAQTAEELTQSNTKLSNAITIFDRQISTAKKRNFIIMQKPKAPKSSWISARD